jgi:hypothetical protein
MRLYSNSNDRWRDKGSRVTKKVRFKLLLLISSPGVLNCRYHNLLKHLYKGMIILLKIYKY